MSKAAGKENFSKHPLIQAFMKGYALTDLPWDAPGLPAGANEAINFYRDFHTRRGPLDDERLAVFASVDVAAFPMREMALLFMCIWAETCSRANRFAELEVLTARCRALLQPSMPPEFHATVMILEGLIVSSRGDKARRINIMNRALEMLDRRSRRWPNIVSAHAFFLAQLGRLADIKDQVEELGILGVEAARSDPDMIRFRYAVDLFRFVDNSENGRLQDAARFKREHESWPAECRNHDSLLLPYLGLSRQLEEWTRPRPPAPGARPAENVISEPWAGVSTMLFNCWAAEALELAHQNTAADPARHIVGIGWDSFDLLRAELANGNGEAARQILSRRAEVGNVHYLEDLFWARAELLSGRREAAAARFARVHRAADHYQAGGRLDIELALALELSPADLVWLGRCSALKAENTRMNLESSRKPPAGQEKRGTERLLGSSSATAAVREAVRRLAPLDASVLITGETGTGKDLVARALHECGPRAELPFIAVNCGAITETLLESELFGHMRGAFTGATAMHRGIFEAAGKGTVFLDEIGEVPPRLQVALLRVLETGDIRPVGSSTSRRVSCRVVAATNADLARMVDEKRFRPDLLYRLRRLEIHIPPLRERREDILPLAEAFLREGRGDGLGPTFSEELREWLVAQNWAGNVRELRNLIEKLRLLNSEKLHYGMSELAVCDVPAVPVRPSTPVRKEPAAAAATRSTVPEEITSYLKSGKTPLRRLERARELFREHKRLTRAELAELLGVSPLTVTRDLKTLVSEGLIEKVQPTASPRTHYFAVRDGQGA